MGDSKPQEYQYDFDDKPPELPEHPNRHRLLPETRTSRDSKREESWSDSEVTPESHVRRIIEPRGVKYRDSKREESWSDSEVTPESHVRRIIAPKRVKYRDSKREESWSDSEVTPESHVRRIIAPKRVKYRDSKREESWSDSEFMPESHVRRIIAPKRVKYRDSKPQEYHDDFDDIPPELPELPEPLESPRHRFIPETRTRRYVELEEIISILLGDETEDILRNEQRTVTIGDRELLSLPPKATELSVDERQEEKVAEAVISSRLSESPAAANTDNNTAILDSFINPTNIELQLSCTEYVDPIESGESTSVQSQDFPMPSLTSHPNPVFSPNWQTVKEFTNQGGQLQREKSEVVLHVPNGAVKPCVPVLIKGAISIDFQKVHSTLDLAADETIVSPVAEYDAGQNGFFQKPICVLLPHFLPPSFCQDYVSVLTFHKDDDGKISTHKMSLLTTSKEEDFYDKFDGQNGFYFTKSGAICVLTYHFSGFLCTYCRTNIEFSPVHLSLYAICRQQERKNVKVCLIMWDKRLHMQDFETQVLTNQEREMKSIQKDKLSMITENVEVKEVGAFMDIPESHKETWIHTAIDDFPIAQTKNLGDVLCSCVNSIPVKIWWSLNDVPCECPTTYFKCSIKVGYINTTATRKTTDLFNFCNSPTKQIFEVDDLKPQSAETESPAYVDTRMHNQINHQKGCLHVYLEKAKYVNCSISPVNNGSENSNSSIEISR